MSKRLIITESEKNEIKSLYNVNEQGENLLDRMFDLGDLKLGSTNTSNTDNSGINIDDLSGSVDENWMKITKKVIDKLEGGYWNPICTPSSRMGKSTETMFGLDRYNGDIENTELGKEFFRIIDNEKIKLGATSKKPVIGKRLKWSGMDKFCSTWTYNYKGGPLEDKLKTIAAKIMKGRYDSFANNYLTPEGKKVVESNPNLLLHFSYATWNGPGFFKTFAKTINDEVKKGTSKSKLIDLAISDRKSTGLLNKQKIEDVIRNPNIA